MIKIIREGTRRVMACESCGCVFSYEKEDVNTSSDPLQSQGCFYVTCPQCKENCVIAQTR